MSPGADNERSLLAARGAITHSGEVIPHDLEGIVQVIEVLNLGDWTKTPHGHSNALSQNGAFPNARIAHADIPKLLLHAFHHLIHPADAPRVLSKRQDPRISTKHGLKIALKDLTAIEHFRFGRIRGRHRVNAERTVRLITVQSAVVAQVVGSIERLEPMAQRIPGR